MVGGGRCMLSKRDIQRELGKGIAIVPFKEENLKDNSINLSAGNYAWGTISHEYYYNTGKNGGPLYFLEEEIPLSERKHYKARYIQAGNSVIVNHGHRKVILLFPHTTTYVETLEVLSTSGNIGGTCHSKVGTAAQGIGHIGTMMGPNYSGNCFVPLHNPTDKLIELPVGETFMSVVFNYLDTPVRERNATTGGHTDKFSSLGIHATMEELNDLNQDWKRSHKAVVEMMNADNNFKQFKKHLLRQRISRVFSKRNIITGCALIAVFVLLAVLAAYVDGKNGTTVWSDRFWTVMAAGIVVYILQILLPRR